MSEHREEYLDLCAGFALGSLDASDRAQLESHLAGGCAECAAALASFDSAVTLLAASAPPVAPPAALRARVLNAARASGAEPATIHRIDAGGGRRSTGWLWGWAAAAACLALAVWSWSGAARLKSELQRQLVRIAALERDRTDLEERLAQEKRWVGVVTGARTRLAEFAATPQGDSSVHGRAFLDPGTRRAVVAFSNLHAPAGHDYELWAIRDGKPRSLGLVRADAAGDALLQIDVDDPATLQALAVSLEPAGGAPTPDAPTGPVVLVGPVGG